MQNFILFASTVLIWGFSWYAIKFQIETVHPLISIGYRSGIAAILIFVFLALTKRLKGMKFTPRQHAYLLLQGAMLFSLNYWVFYIGTDYLTSGLVAVTFSSMTLMNVYNQALIFKLPVNRQVVIASLLGLVGIACVFWPEIQGLDFEGPVVTGIGICLFATYLASLGNMAALRNARDNIPILRGTAVSMVYGAIFSFAIALLSGADTFFDPSPGYIWSLLYLGVFGSALGFACYLTVLKNIGADKAAYTTVLFPIVALCVSTVFEGYIWTIPAFMGIGLIIAGNVLVMRKQKT